MKNHIIALVIVICALTLGCNTLFAAPKRLKGSGNLVQKEVVVRDAYDAVSASRAVKVRLVEGSSNTLTVEADDNVIDYITIAVKERTLDISIDRDCNSIQQIHATVTVPTDGRLRKLRASSAAKIVAEPTIRSASVDLDASSAARITASVEARECELDASSAARIEAEVKGRACSVEASSSAKIAATLAVEECEIDVSSAGKAQLKGAALKCDAEASSAAKIAAGDLAVKDCRISSSSGASASICCLETLDATASSGGSVRYTGDCTVRRYRTSSGGSIRRM